MSLQDEITQAIGAHGMWKTRLRCAIDTGKTDTNDTNVGKDDQCEFGQWLYGPTIDAATKTSGDFREVQKLHAEFHKAAAHVLKIALEGNKAEAEKMLALGSVFNDASARLTAAMMHWRGP
jgi:hypothetical protein